MSQIEQKQNAQILEYLKSGATITQIQAYHMFGCWRLSARIYDLRYGDHDGNHYEIIDAPHQGRHAEYKYTGRILSGVAIQGALI